VLRRIFHSIDKGESLGMPESEFNDYLHGKAIPSETWDSYISESLHSMRELSSVVSEMKQRHEEFLQNIENLRQTLKKKEEWVSGQVDTILERTPLTFKPRKVPTNLDEEDAGTWQSSLPVPLQPEVVGVVSQSLGLEGEGEEPGA